MMKYTTLSTSIFCVGFLFVLATTSLSTLAVAFTPVPVEGCFRCGQVPDPVCCAGGQNCPDGKPCCAKPGQAGFSCNTTCVPKCTEQQTCGEGGCGSAAGPWGCGKCPQGSGCRNNFRCMKCCFDRTCGSASLPGCEGVNCGSCKPGYGCLGGSCSKCCPDSTKCGPSNACNGVSCGSCPSGTGCRYGEECQKCCENDYHEKRTCGLSPWCGNVSCGPKCPAGSGCNGNGQCQQCCPAENGCGKSFCGHSCGTCDPNSATCGGYNKCVCKAICSCGSGACRGCPAESDGCSSSDCSCRGPRKASQPLFAHSFAYYTMNMYRYGCKDGSSGPCGTIQPADGSSALSSNYSGESGYASAVSIVAAFVSPTGKPLPGENIFVSFSKGGMPVPPCCESVAGFQVGLSNCTRTKWSYCTSGRNMTCMKQEAIPPNCNWQNPPTSSTTGNGKGLWFKNPGSPIFHVIISVNDVYYGCNQCGNQNSMVINPRGFSVQYNMDE